MLLAYSYLERIKQPELNRIRANWTGEAGSEPHQICCLNLLSMSDMIDWMKKKVVLGSLAWYVSLQNRLVRGRGDSFFVRVFHISY